MVGKFPSPKQIQTLDSLGIRVVVYCRSKSNGVEYEASSYDVHNDKRFRRMACGPTPRRAVKALLVKLTDQVAGDVVAQRATKKLREQVGKPVPI